MQVQWDALDLAIEVFINCTLDLWEQQYTLHLEYRKMREINKYLKDTKAMRTITGNLPSIPDKTALLLKETK